MTAPSSETIRNMEDISFLRPSGRKPYSYWIYTDRTSKTPSQWGIPVIRLWKTQLLQGFRRNVLRQER